MNYAARQMLVRRPHSEQPYAYLLTETDVNDIVTLQQAGIPRTHATVLIALYKHGQGVKVTSHWIERSSNLRQPEVSIAMSELQQAGLVKATEDKNLSKGRPVKVYKVTASIPGYIRGQIADRMAELNRGAMAINRIFAQGAPA